MSDQNSSENGSGQAPGVDRFRIAKSLQTFGCDIGRVAGRAPLRFSLVAVLTLQTLTFIALRPCYETNDDVFMSMIASGKGICPAPDQHLVFTNVLIGDVLKSLYTAYAGFPWYGCYLLLVHVLAQSIILYCALVVGRESQHATNTERAGSAGLLRLGLYLLYFALVEIPLLNRLQFTSTAFIAAQAGIFLLLFAWQRRIARANAAIASPLCAAVAMLVLGGMVRIESLAMAILVATPVVLLCFKNFSLRAVAPCALAVATAAFLLAAVTAYDVWAYARDPAWHGFRSFNQLRGNFHDGSWTYYSPKTAPIFTSVGWTENDHAMIARWFSDNPELYSEAKLTSIVEAYPWKSHRQMKGLFWDAFRDIARNRSVLSILLVLTVLVLGAQWDRNAKLAVVVSAAAALALLVLVIWVKKVPPERVYFPLISFPLALGLLMYPWRRSASAVVGQRSTTWSTWRFVPSRRQFTTGLIIFALVMGNFRMCRQSILARAGRAELQQFLRTVRPEDRQLVVSWEAALPIELFSPLDNLDAWSHRPLLSLAWPQNTPCQEAIKRQFGITNVARALYERDDIVLVATPTHRELFQKFAKEHFGEDVEFTASRPSSKRFVEGRFQKPRSGSELSSPESTASKRSDTPTR
jgi:hypothetical protein